jgi:hypothetical protein
MKPKIRLRKRGEKVVYLGKKGKRYRTRVGEANEDRKKEDCGRRTSVCINVEFV